MPQIIPINWLVTPIFLFLIILLIFINIRFRLFFMSPKISKILLFNKDKIWIW